ncbi:hypothetical protein K8T06_07165 [bacterium]|nr:hypothetical protein [bacterium]
MTNKKDTTKFRGCEKIRPIIRITPAEKTINNVDCKELRWWGIVPNSGESVLMAIYDLPDWELTSVTELKVTGSGSVHGVKGKVITQEEWSKNSDWQMERLRVIGRLTDDTAQWMAMLTGIDDNGDGLAITSFLDEEFQSGFPDIPRQISDRKNWAKPEEDVMVVKELKTDRLVCWGAGTFNVTVGDNSIRCLRVMECTLSEKSMLIEAYVGEDGRTVLVRRYNGIQWQVKEDEKFWNERLPEQPILKINGISFVHWYDCLFL